MPDSVEVICDGVLFATLVSEDLPATNAGRKKASETGPEIEESTADFPSAPTKPKRKRSRRKTEVLEVE